MFFKVFNKGFAGSNSYILGDNSEAVVIDAGNKADEIYEEAVNKGFRIKYIILTHGHLDHIMFVDELKRKTNAKVAIGEHEAAAMKDPRYNVSAIFGMPKVFGAADLLLKDGDTINFSGHLMKIHHTPGHTKGGICIECEDMLFTGDTLFDGDFGRTDMPYGDSKVLRNTIEKLFKMDGSLTVYPGHDNSNKLESIVNKCRAENLLDEDNWNS